MTISPLPALIADPMFAVPLFDALPDVVFFVKDLAGRYLAVNQTLAGRCGHKSKLGLLGRTTLEVFPKSLALNYQNQDRAVLAGEKEIHAHLELHLYPNHAPGWCLTHKIPLRDSQGGIVGLAGISRDLALPDQGHPAAASIAAAVTHIQERYSEPLPMSSLCRIAKLSVSQVERYFDRIYSLTPRQMIVKTRLEAASAMLVRGGSSITDIALACGYQDHSAFTRVFKATVGMSPSEYRALRSKPSGDSADPPA